MYSRKEIVGMFSTFLQLERDRFSKWVTDIKLRRSMEKCLDYSPGISKDENFWAIYWHNNWRESQSNLIAEMHIKAYLQETCYWASQKTAAKITNKSYSLADLFQMANTEVGIVLKGFNPIKSSSLKAYGIMVIQSRLRDILQRQKDAYICSDWALLRKVTKKFFVEALNNAGLSESAIVEYRLAWNCFKEVYVQEQTTGIKTLQKPTSQQLEAIANLYNSSRHQLTEITSECTTQKIEKWLNQSVIYVRTYLFPPLKSLDSFQRNDDTSQPQTLDIPDPSSDSLITDMIVQEDVQHRQKQVSEMFAVLSEALQALDTRSQKLIKLYYQEGLTQQQIMQELQISQSTVSRQLVKNREYLLKALVKWSQDLNISVNPNQIKDISTALEEWLRNQSTDSSINP